MSRARHGCPAADELTRLLCSHFQNPPRYQLLHCLRNRVSGGLSTFADAFRTSALLLQADPDAFSLLASHPIPFEYVNPHSGHHTSWARPTIELKDGWTSQDVIDQPELLPEALMAVNYAPPFQGPLLTHPPSGPPRLREQAYGPARQAAIRQALSDWVSLLEREEERWTCRLEEGQCVAFDNRRVLHARTAFEEQSGPAGEVSADEEEPQVKRWLKGYVVADCSGSFGDGHQLTTFLQRVRRGRLGLGPPARPRSQVWAVKVTLLSLSWDVSLAFGVYNAGSVQPHPRYLRRHLGGSAPPPPPATSSGVLVCRTSACRPPLSSSPSAE